MSSFIITCSACGTANRIPAEKEGGQGRCGKCGVELARLYIHPQQMTDTSFDAFITGFQGPVLAEFWAPW